MGALVRVTVSLTATLFLTAASPAVVVEPKNPATRHGFPSPHVQYAYLIPESLRNGSATTLEVIDWSKTIINSMWKTQSRWEWPLPSNFSFVDLNADGLSEILVEIPWAAGATGNRAAAFFIASESGYRYLGTIARVAARRCFPDAQACYIVTVGTGGQDMGLVLISVTNGALIHQAGCELNKFDDHEASEQLLALPESHDELLRMYGLGPNGETDAIHGCKAIAG